MRSFRLCLTSMLLACVLLNAQEKPVPPGRQELKNYQAKNADVPPPQVSATRPDPAKLQKEATELADLARSIPPDIDSVSKGALPKDVLDKLKRIEKISQHLRGEIAP